MDRKYNAESELMAPTQMEPFSRWIRHTIRNEAARDPSFDKDTYHLSIPPLCMAWSYKAMKAYGNHFRVNHGRSSKLGTYDSGLLSVFVQERSDLGYRVCNLGYVGELADIIKLDYGQTSIPIILMRGTWIRNTTEGDNAAMVKDEFGFLTVDWRQKLRMWEEPFVWPAQVEQCFFVDVDDEVGWKVVLHKPARARRYAGSIADFCLEDHAAFQQIMEPAEAPSADVDDEPDLSDVRPLTRDDQALASHLDSHHVEADDSTSSEESESGSDDGTGDDDGTSGEDDDDVDDGPARDDDGPVNHNSQDHSLSF